MILPAIIGDTFLDIEQKLEKVRGVADWVQVDVVDGVFAPNTTWPYASGDLNELADLPAVPNIELHLMVQKPRALVNRLLELPIGRVLFHLESFSDPDELRELLTIFNSTEGKDAGIALCMPTPVEAVARFLDVTQTIQLMSIETIGTYGNSFTENVYPRIRQLRALSSNATIEVDGGVSLENAQQLIQAGADNLVVGSALFNAEHLDDTFAEFSHIGA